MRISIINGSPRSMGATATLLKECQRYLQERYQTDVEYIDLASAEMRFCTGCMACYRTGQCTIKDDGVEALADKVKAADGLIIGTPTHGSNVSALLKNFMDRGHFIVEQGLRNKQGFSLVTYEIADGQEVLKAVEKFLLVSGASRRGKLLVKLDFNTNPFANHRLQAKLHQQLDKFMAAMLEKRPKSIYEQLFNDWIVVNIIWKPIFLRQPRKYSGILKSWREKGILGD
jgi:multimeric flavodoxin WrbA